MFLNCGTGEVSRVTRRARQSNQSILREIIPEYSLEGLMLKLKFQLWPLDEESWLMEKKPDAGKDWRQEKGTTVDKMVGWHHWLNWHVSKQALRDGKGQAVQHATVHRVAKSQTWLSNWTTITSDHWIRIWGWAQEFCVLIIFWADL